MTANDNWRLSQEKQANSFQMAFCGDPTCGLHIIALKADGSPICEVVMSAAQTLAMIKVCQDSLYDKATDRS